MKRSLFVCCWALSACASRQPGVTETPVAPSHGIAATEPVAVVIPPPVMVNATARIVEMRNAAATRVTFRAVIRVGSADDPTGKEGLTRLTTKLMVEGGTRALTYEQLTRRLFPMAASIRFQIDRDYLVITGESHRDHVAEFYPLLRDVILTPRLGEEDFRRVKTQSLSELRMGLRGSSDETLGKEVLQSLIYADHPYGHPTVGTERGLEALALADAVAQHQTMLCASRMTFGISGGYPENFAETLRADLATLRAQCAEPAALPVPARPHGLHVVIVDKPASSSTAISFGFPLSVTRDHADFAALQLATSYLGLHRQSVGVLYQTIREARGLNYGDYCYAEHFEQETSSRFPRSNILRRQQYASVWIRPVPSRVGHFALRAAMRAVDRVVREGIAQSEIERVRGFLNGYIGLYTQTDSARLGFAIDDVFAGRPQETWTTTMRSAWSQITAETLTAAVQRNFTSQDMWVAIIAPNAQELATAIRSNAPSPITYDSPKPDSVLTEDREIVAYPLPVQAADVRVVSLAEVFR
jgi:zinc protease